MISTLDQVSTGVSSKMGLVGGEEEDYFVHFEDFEFTEEDLVRVDCICEGGLHPLVTEPVLPLPELGGKAVVAIEVEQELQSVPEVISPPTPSSRRPRSVPPYEAFRNGKSLSVSDLTGPLWWVCWHGTSESCLLMLCRCELQYEYRQRQGWGLRVKDRPQTFVSREGNTIVASHTIASNNENVLKAGRVGFALEVDLPPTESSQITGRSPPP